MGAVRGHSTRWRDERGQAVPLVAIVVAIALMVTLGMAELATSVGDAGRARAAADAAALAGVEGGHAARRGAGRRERGRTDRVDEPSRRQRDDGRRHRPCGSSQGDRSGVEPGSTRLRRPRWGPERVPTLDPCPRATTTTRPRDPTRPARRSQWLARRRPRMRPSSRRAAQRQPGGPGRCRRATRNSRSTPSRSTPSRSTLSRSRSRCRPSDPCRVPGAGRRPARPEHPHPGRWSAAIRC